MRLMSILLMLLCLFLAARPSAAASPNLVVFFSDDHGYGDSPVYGGDDVQTPNMQRLAKAGLTFTHAFVASPACAPSRAAMLTGLMPARNGAEANHSQPRNEIRKLPAYLQKLGYEVAAFGKVAHARSAPKYGFDHVDKQHQTGRVRQYLRSRQTDRPLCLMVGTHPPHVPWPQEHPDYDPQAIHVPPTHVDLPQTREFRSRYYQDITTADRELGEIYDLSREMLGEETLFLYTSDHGAQWPFGKWNLYDAGIRVPLIAVWPGVIEPGTVSEAMVSWIDLLPTFVEIAGGTPPTDIDGRSFASVLRGETETHRDRIFTTHSGDGRMNVYPIRSLRTRRWKYILNLHPEFAYTTHIDQAAGKDGLRYWLPWREAAKVDPRAAEVIERYYRRPSQELYDLDHDPHEQKNVAADPAHADRLQAMHNELQAWMNDQHDEGTVFEKPRLLSVPSDWAPASAVP